jgi:hypothetical protein
MSKLSAGRPALDGKPPAGNAGGDDPDRAVSVPPSEPQPLIIGVS